MENVCNLANTGVSKYQLILLAVLLTFTGFCALTFRRKNHAKYYLSGIFIVLSALAVNVLMAPALKVQAQSQCTNQGTTSDASQPNTDNDISALLAEAPLLLRASAITQPWSGNVWNNEGTLGSAYSATADEASNGTQLGVPVSFEPNYSNGAGFLVEGLDPGHLNEYGFRIPNNTIFDIPNSGSRTFTFDITPLDHTDPDYKVAWKYTGIALPTFQPGWVLEHIDDIGGGPGSGGLIWAQYDGTNILGQINSGNVGGRQTLTLRIDRNNDTAQVFRNGVLLSSFTGNDISTLADATSAADLLLAKGNVFHNVAVHDRGLTNAEILQLHQELSSM